MQRWGVTMAREGFWVADTHFIAALASFSLRYPTYANLRFGSNLICGVHKAVKSEVGTPAQFRGVETAVNAAKTHGVGQAIVAAAA